MLNLFPTVRYISMKIYVLLKNAAVKVVENTKFVPFNCRFIFHYYSDNYINYFFYFYQDFGLKPTN